MRVEGDPIRFRFRLEDDDTARRPFAVSSTLLTEQSDVPSQNVFAQAYVRIAYDLPTTTRTAEFMRNVEVPEGLAQAKQTLDEGRDPQTNWTRNY